MSYPQYPETVYIGITDKCNANCVICWRRASNETMLDFDKELLEKIKPFLSSVKVIGWWGDGEIFAHSDIDYILSIMKEMPNTKHRFSTNGKGLVKYAEELAQINIDEIIISIDGATEGTLSRIRVGVHLANITDGIKSLQTSFAKNERPMPKLIFAFTSLMSNIYELPKMVELAKDLSVSEIRVQPLNPHHSDLESENLTTVAPGLEKYYFTVTERLGEQLGVVVNHCNPARL
jgi:MoaA/NifB/PqqE/SkfB family radical SAM enzyme